MTRIINLRGTSGVGKTTLANKLRGHMGPAQPLYRMDVPDEVLANAAKAERLDKRKKPVGYLHGKHVSLGHYETACGGTDTLPSHDVIHALGDHYAAQGHGVLSEGLLWSWETKRTLRWHANHDLKVILLTTPLEECLDRIAKRRLARGNEKPLNPDNTIKQVRSSENACRKLEAQGVLVLRLNAEDAFYVAATHLGLDF